MLTKAELNAMNVGQIVVDQDGDEWVKISRYGWESGALVYTSTPLFDRGVRRKEIHVEQPMPTASSGPSMHVLASEVLGERMAIGLDRYGQPLQVLNGRSATRDVIEELADGLAYALQIREERRLLREELTALAVEFADSEVDERVSGIIHRYLMPDD